MKITRKERLLVVSRIVKEDVKESNIVSNNEKIVHHNDRIFFVANREEFYKSQFSMYEKKIIENRGKTYYICEI